MVLVSKRSTPALTIKLSPSIIQRAGVVPLSIAGIFKEVTTISFSLWVFGDQLTELNVIGVIITIFGESRPQEVSTS